MHVKIRGIEKAMQDVKDRAQKIKGEKGDLYPRLSEDVQFAIEHNADSSYDNSPAKTKAIQNAELHNWNHGISLHVLPIMTDTFANYRQYGCGGIAISILVQITGEDIKKMIERFASA